MKTLIRKPVRDQERLKRMIKTMYLLREILVKKSDDDRAFQLKSKKSVIREVDEIIDLGLEEFYMLRTS